ncbi:MAG: xanthine dehydrogenase family protein subunit M [Nakamurella sp.]
MILPTFEYTRARSVEHALDLLRGGDGRNGSLGEGHTDIGRDSTRLLAGGQSLLPMMKLRLAAPEALIDIGDLRELRYIRREGDTIAIGAGMRYCDLLTSDVIRQSVPLIARATAHIGDAQVRYRGTIGGSLAHADPAADLPVAALALDANIVIHGGNGERVVAAADFFVDYFSTAIGDDEMLTEVRIKTTGSEKCSFERFSQRSNEWSIVAVAVAGTRIALAGMGPTPLRAEAAQYVLESGGDFAAAAELAAHGTNPIGDGHAEPDYRRHLARVLTRRALERAHHQ